MSRFEYSCLFLQFSQLSKKISPQRGGGYSMCFILESQQTRAPNYDKMGVWENQLCVGFLLLQQR